MRRLIPLLVALVVASCAPAASAPAPTADSGPDTADTISPVTTSPPIATAVATPAATATRTAPPGPGSVVGAARADFDCDGLPDLIEFFNAPRPGTYTSLEAGKLARLTRSAGATVELPFDGMPFDDPGRNPLIGLADVNGDGCDDAIVSVGHGASTTWTTFLVYDRGELRRVEENGKPVMFLFGGSVRHGNAIECRQVKDASEIVARGIYDATDFQWDAVEDVHHWSTRSQLVLWSTSRSVIAVSVRNAQPPDPARYWGLTCGNVKLAG